MANLYPELDEKELNELLEDELLRMSPGGHCQVKSSSKHTARFERGDRSSGVALAAEERLFLVDFWHKGVELGSAQTNSVNEVAKIISAFLVEQLSSAEMRRRFPHFAIREQAPVHELGAEAALSWQWENIKQHVTESFADLL